MASVSGWVVIGGSEEVVPELRRRFSAHATTAGSGYPSTRIRDSSPTMHAASFVYAQRDSAQLTSITAEILVHGSRGTSVEHKVRVVLDTHGRAPRAGKTSTVSSADGYRREYRSDSHDLVGRVTWPPRGRVVDAQKSAMVISAFIMVGTPEKLRWIKPFQCRS